MVAVAGLILVTAYFVAGEFAFVAVRRGRLEELAASGDRKAATAVEVHRRLSFMLSGAQLGITATSLVIGFIAEPTVGRALQPVVGAVGVPERAQASVALTVGFVLATAAQMVIGELAPKNIAIARADAGEAGLEGDDDQLGPVVRSSTSIMAPTVRTHPRRRILPPESPPTPAAVGEDSTPVGDSGVMTTG